MHEFVDRPRLLIIAGGTGGHIAPALAVAEALRARRPGAVCRAVCSQRPLDAHMLEAARREGVIDGWTPIPARPLRMTPRGLAGLAANWGLAVRATREAIGTLRGSERRAPVTAITTGGFVAPPAMQAARVERCRTAVIALDAVPGRAASAVGRWAQARFDASPGAAGRPRPGWVITGPIVRPGAQPLTTPQEARRSLGLDPDRPTVLITGGSQGARSLNGFVLGHLEAHAPAWAGWQAVHLCGPDDAGVLTLAYARASVPAVIQPFLDQMGPAWAAASLHIGRGGAGTVGEALRAGVPSLIFPYPYHRDRHQALNAAALVEAGLADVVEDHRDPTVNLARYGNLLAERMTAGADRAKLPGFASRDERAAVVVLSNLSLVR